jgi:hypothetical protein
LNRLEKDFLKNGGLRERMTRERRKFRGDERLTELDLVTLRWFQSMGMILNGC